MVCSDLSDRECSDWRSCCSEAEVCCERQRKQQKIADVISCPSTWDGYGCFMETLGGSVAEIGCPSYVKHRKTSGQAFKTCLGNGSWWINSKNGREWTDYTACIPFEEQKFVMYAGIVSCTVSMLLLLPSLLIFMSIRQLRKQLRIRIHTSLFTSFVLYCTVTILWDVFIFKDRIEYAANRTNIVQKPIFCRILYLLMRYFRSSNYMWMLNEAYFLHHLITAAFRIPQTLRWYYLLGWGFPVIPLSIYTGIKSTVQKTGCWVDELGVFEWVVYVPNLVCIIVNVLLLFNILRILLTRLQNHPNEPNHFRQATKATLLLTPLFGIHLFFIIYRPSSDTSRVVYEVISKIITDSQGAVVSLLFCFFNNEVHGYILAGRCPLQIWSTCCHRNTKKHRRSGFHSQCSSFIESR
ncbi:calcitonin gene-related peptide type 1 receptor-like [Ostrea edulis]|uniref:calcitonin gene-related peptide type 1 receptor-like n=1 Tax=Ostrea edulis TaxID=37623 RepID=UPI0024AF8CAC|nr:calcitonin gene-related peptide type 1 receptor-like [Ostrea edulis]